MQFTQATQWIVILWTQIFILPAYFQSISVSPSPPSFIPTSIQQRHMGTYILSSWSLPHLRYPIHSVFNADNIEGASLTFLSLIHSIIQSFNKAHWPLYQNVSLSISWLAPCQHLVLALASSLTGMAASFLHHLSTPALSLYQAILYTAHHRVFHSFLSGSCSHGFYQSRWHYNLVHL